MNLYEIDAAIQEILDRMVDPETGEVSDDALSVLEGLGVQRQDKIENIALYIKNLAADAAAIKAEEDTLSKRRKTAESQVSRLKSYLSEHMMGEKMETPRVKIGWRSSTSVYIENEAEFVRQFSGTDFLSCKDPTINKTNVGNALKSGKVIPGAELVTSMNIQVK